MTSPDTAPSTDADVPGFWQALGLPGLIDVHVHFMPQNVMDKVWAYFDAAGPLVGMPWPVEYRSEQEDRLRRLRAMGVRAFPSLLYAHRPGMAEWLNSWAAEFAEQHSDVIRTATFFPELEAATYVERALHGGARIFKSHLQVGAYDPRDPLLDGVWGLLAEAAVPVVVHCGNWPAPGPFTGYEPFAEVMSRHPGLTAVIAHMGLPEYAQFLALAERYPRVHLDTTMAFTDFTERRAPWPRVLTPRLVELAERIVLGSDFPNTPYPFSHQLAALARLELGDDWLRAVLYDNGARLLGIPSRER